MSERGLDLREVRLCIPMGSLYTSCCWAKASSGLSRVSVGGFSARAPGLPHLAFSDLSKCLRNVDFCRLFSTCVARNGFLCSCSFWKSETKLWTSVRLMILLISGCFLGYCKEEKDCHQIDHKDHRAMRSRPGCLFGQVPAL